MAARESVRANAEGAARLERLLSQVGKDSETLDPAASAEALAGDDCRELAAMLLASARRRRDEGLHDVSALFSYRVLALVPQRRLVLACGVDPGRLDDDSWNRLVEHSRLPDAAALVERYNDGARNPEHRLDVTALPTRIARAAAFRLLQVVAGDVADGMAFARYAGIGDARNRSVLAHGLRLLGEKTAEDVSSAAEALFERMLEIEGVSGDEREALRARHEFARA